MTWPKGDNVYIYDPNQINPETELCLSCHHSKKYHTLESSSNRYSLKEFNNENIERYSIKYREDTPSKHPSDIPESDLVQFYKTHPNHPGATLNIGKSLLTEINEDQPKKSLADIDDEGDFEEEEEL